MFNKQLAFFVVAGGVAAAANFGSRICLGRIMNYVSSIVLAYCIGMVVAFILNRIFVFQEADNSPKEQLLWFLLVNLVAVVQTVLISLLLAEWLFPFFEVNYYPKTIAHAVAVVVPVMTSYLGHKHLSFRKQR